MPGNPANIDYKRRIDQVIDYIFGHPDTQISLQTLAGVANYSPFHLQKIFNQGWKFYHFQSQGKPETNQ